MRKIILLKKKQHRKLLGVIGMLSYMHLDYCYCFNSLKCLGDWCPMCMILFKYGVLCGDLSVVKPKKGCRPLQLRDVKFQNFSVRRFFGI